MKWAEIERAFAFGTDNGWLPLNVRFLRISTLRPKDLFLTDSTIEEYTSMLCINMYDYLKGIIVVNITGRCFFEENDKVDSATFYIVILNIILQFCERYLGIYGSI